MPKLTEEQIMLSVIRDHIAQAPAHDREAINAAVVEMRAVLLKFPLHGGMALALLGAELAAQ